MDSGCELHINISGYKMTYKKNYTVSELITCIKKVFSIHLRPNTVIIAGQELRGDYEDALWFQGRDWESIEWDDWQNYPDSLTFFHPEAFRYYLPSALILSVKHKDKWLWVADSLMMSLIDLHDDTPWRESVYKRFQVLNLSELQLLHDWCKLMTDAEGYGHSKEAWSQINQNAVSLIQNRRDV
jgi:hypothetical protein